MMARTASHLGWRTFSGFALTIGLLVAAESAFAQNNQPAKAGPVGEVVSLINEKIEQTWKDNKLTPSRACDDFEFIRRASLDIVGRIATPEEITAFLKDPASSRRAQLIERLLKSDEYPRNWANLWSNWLLTRSAPFGRGKYHEQMQAWLEDQFAQNKSHKEIVAKLITASGKNTDNGAVNFILAHVGEPVPAAERGGRQGQFEMVPITSRITRLFLGIQTQCTQCHDHPFDNSLQQKHFWGINVMLRQVVRDGTPPNPQMRRQMGYPELTLREDKSANLVPEFENVGALPYEKRNGVIQWTKATFFNLSRSALEEKQKEARSRRDLLGELVVEHEMFPKAYVNRMWAHFFGRGFVNPIDDFNEQNQPSHPELLGELAAKVKHYNYDQHDLIRWICNSDAYQLSCVTNKTNATADAEPYFSRALLRPMTPEQLFESLSIATQKGGTKEAQAADRDRWLDNLIGNFGDDEGNEVTYNGTIVQALMMMNGADINQAISSGTGAVAKVVRSRGATNTDAIVRELYLTALNRLPRPAEMIAVKQALPLYTVGAGGRLVQIPEKDAQHKYQDLYWALLNCNEFMLNH
jgi:hypothetical protein